jgi:membrane protein required for colicin V production
MNIIDIILIIPIIWFMYQGFKKGFIIELASLIALILGIYAALYSSNYATDFLKNNLKLEGEYLPIISFILTFVVVVIIVYVIGKIIERFIDIIALGFINRIFGGLFGILKAAVFLSIVILIINHFNDDLISHEKKEGSFLYEPIAEIAPFLWQKFEQFNKEDIPLKNWDKDQEEIQI